MLEIGNTLKEKNKTNKQGQMPHQNTNVLWFYNGLAICLKPDLAHYTRYHSNRMLIDGICLKAEKSTVL